MDTQTSARMAPLEERAGELAVEQPPAAGAARSRSCSTGSAASCAASDRSSSPPSSRLSSRAGCPTQDTSASPPLTPVERPPAPGLPNSPELNAAARLARLSAAEELDCRRLECASAPGYSSAAAPEASLEQGVEAAAATGRPPDDRRGPSTLAAANQVELRFLVRRREAGALIGKRGSNIKRLRELFRSAVFNIPDSGNGPERVVCISAERACLEPIVEDLTRLLMEKSPEKDEQIELKLLIHSSQAGSIIGMGGQSIRKLRNDSKAAIKIYELCCPYSSERVCAIKARPPVVLSTIKLIQAILDANPIKGAVKPYEALHFDPMFADKYGGYLPEEPAALELACRHPFGAPGMHVGCRPAPDCPAALESAHYQQLAGWPGAPPADYPATAHLCRPPAAHFRQPRALARIRPASPEAAAAAGEARDGAQPLQQEASPPAPGGEQAGAAPRPLERLSPSASRRRFHPYKEAGVEFPACGAPRPHCQARQPAPLGWEQVRDGAHLGYGALLRRQAAFGCAAGPAFLADPPALPPSAMLLGGPVLGAPPPAAQSCRHGRPCVCAALAAGQAQARRAPPGGGPPAAKRPATQHSSPMGQLCGLLPAHCPAPGRCFERDAPGHAHTGRH